MLLIRKEESLVLSCSGAATMSTTEKIEETPVVKGKGKEKEEEKTELVSV